MKLVVKQCTIHEVEEMPEDAAKRILEKQKGVGKQKAMKL